MGRSRRVLGLVAAVALALLGAAVLVDSARELGDRWRARDGASVPGVVVDRYRSYRAWFPTATVAYAVDGRTYRRDVSGHLDVDEQVEVRVVPGDPQTSRVVGEGGAGLASDLLAGLVLVGLAPVEVRRAFRDARRRPEPAPAEPPRPGDRDAWRPRVVRGAAVGAGAGAATWVVLAVLLGAGPPREVATALLGTVGSGTAVGALLGLLRARGALVRTGRRGAFRLGVLGLLLAVPLVLVLAAALEG